MASLRRKLIVRCMASSVVLVTLTAFGWWWCMWPVWTAQEFIRHFGASELRYCNELVTNPDLAHRDWSWIRPDNAQFRISPRRVTDTVQGRVFISSAEWTNVTMEVELGRITFCKPGKRIENVTIQ